MDAENSLSRVSGEQDLKLHVYVKTRVLSNSIDGRYAV